MAYSHFNNISIASLAAAVPSNKQALKEHNTGLDERQINEYIENSNIQTKYIAKDEQTASDLGFAAAKNIIDQFNIDVNEIGVLIFVTRTPDYRNPPSAVVIQHRLGIPIDCLVYDINLGGTGFTSGLQVACSLMQSMDNRYGFVIIGDTSSKLTTNSDTLSLEYGDGVAAVLLEKVQNNEIHSLTCSKGYDYNRFIHRGGGFRYSKNYGTENEAYALATDIIPGLHIESDHYWNFLEKDVPKAFNDFLDQSKIQILDYDLIIFNQERKDVLNTILEKLNIPGEKIPMNMEKFGNTQGASIPILLSDQYSGDNDKAIKVISCGFGEGFSVGITAFSIQTNNILPLLYSNDIFDNGHVSHEI